MMEQLKKWAKENPGEKVRHAALTTIASADTDLQTMVISQWTSCLALVSNYLAEQGIAHVRFDQLCLYT
jgi:SNF2 family DNA or RNA helicase